jgi:hypothetical protein
MTYRHRNSGYKEWREWRGIRAPRRHTLDNRISYVLIYFRIVLYIVIQLLGSLCIELRTVMLSCASTSPLIAYALQPTTYNLQPTTYNLQPTTYNLQPTTYNLQPTTFNLQPTTYNLQPKTYNLQPTTHTTHTTYTTYTTQACAVCCMLYAVCCALPIGGALLHLLHLFISSSLPVLHALRPLLLYSLRTSDE